MVNALQRSAHHVFISELLASTERHCFLNAVHGGRLFSPGYIRAAPSDRFVNDMALDLDREMSAAKTPKALLVYNSETVSTADARTFFDAPATVQAAGPSERRVFVTWLRDPLNNMASLFQIAWQLKQQGAFTESIARRPKVKMTRDTWVDHWSAAQAGKAGHVVMMNRWFRDDSTRKAVFRALALEPPPRHARTTPWGGGSSFKDHAAGTPAPDIEALERRYERFADHPDFIEIFADAAVVSAVDTFFETQALSSRLTDGWAQLRRNALGG